MIPATPANAFIEPASKPRLSTSTGDSGVSTPGGANASSRRAEAPGLSGPHDLKQHNLERYGLWLLAGLCFLLFFYQLGSYWLFDFDEPRYAEAAREMIERQSWITPYFNGALRLEKPVLFYWLLIGAYKLFGLSEFSARLVSAVASTGVVAMVYAFARRWRSSRYALISALILATSIEWIVVSRMAMTDMTLAACMTATTICLFQVARSSARWWLAAGVFSGLAVLTKGPVGLVLPGSVLVAYATLTRQWRSCFLTPWFPAGVAACFAVALPWYWMAWQENGQIFLNSLFNNNVSRFSGAVIYHPQPPYYYLVVLAAGLMPWTPFLPAAIRHSWQRIQHDYFPRYFQSPEKSIKTLNTAEHLHLFSVLWAGLVLAFFTVADTKLPTYILPMFPALALWLGELFYPAEQDQIAPTQVAQAQKQLPPQQADTHWLARTGLIFGGLLSIAGLAAIWTLPRVLPKAAGHLADNPFLWAGIGILWLGTLVFAWILKSGDTQKAVLTMGVTMAIVTAVLVEGVVPVVNQATQGAMMTYAQRVGQQPLAVYEIFRPSLIYYTRRNIPHIPRDARDKLVAFVSSGCARSFVASSPVRPKFPCQPVYLVTKNPLLGALRAIQPTNTTMALVDHGSIYSLIRLQANGVMR